LLAFEIEINGDQRILAGFSDWDTLHITLLAVREASEEEQELRLHLSGSAQITDEEIREHVRWKTPEVSVGDEVKIRIVEVAEADIPAKRYRSDKTVQDNPFTEAEIEEMERMDYERLCKKFGGDS